MHAAHRYQSTVLGSYQTIELIETFVNYAESIKRCVCIVYDPQTSARGTLTLKAITLKDNFIKVQLISGQESYVTRTLWNTQPTTIHRHVLCSFMPHAEAWRVFCRLPWPA